MLEILSKQLIKFRDLSRTTAELFQVYYNKLEFSGFSGVQPYLSNEIVQDLNYMTSSTKLSEMAAKSSNINEIFDAYHEIMNYYYKLHKILNIFNNSQVDISKQGSYTSSGGTMTLTYIKDLGSLLETINLVFQSFQVEIFSGDLIRSILKELESALTNIRIEKIGEINKIYYDYTQKEQGELVIDLYGSILHRIILLNTGTAESKEIIKYVNKSVELLKSQILEVELNSQEQNKSVNTVQNMIQMHNLSPDGISIPLPNLMSKLKIDIPFENDPTDTKKLEKYLKNASKILSSDKKYGFIVISKIIKKPIEYNIWTLIDKKYLEENDLLQESNVGINNKILKRSNTIVPVRKYHGTSDSILVIKDEFSEDEDLNYFYVLETIDGENYRFLNIWPIIYDRPIYHMPANRIENITNKNISPSRRLECYNVLINQEIVNYLKKPYISVESLTAVEFKKEDTYWVILREKIKKQIVADFVNLFVENFIEGSNKINVKNVSNIILNDTLYRQALNHITENIELDSISELHDKIKGNIVKQFQLELTISYFYDLSNIQKSLKRDVENIYRSEYYLKVYAIIGNNPPESKEHFIKNKITEIFEIIIGDVLEKFVNKRSGIYLSIQKKFDILSKTLLE